MKGDPVAEGQERYLALSPKDPPPPLPTSLPLLALVPFQADPSSMHVASLLCSEAGAKHGRDCVRGGT